MKPASKTAAIGTTSGITGFVLGKFSDEILGTTQGLIAFVAIIFLGLAYLAFTQYLNHKNKSDDEN